MTNRILDAAATALHAAMPHPQADHPGRRTRARALVVVDAVRPLIREDAIDEVVEYLRSRVDVDAEYRMWLETAARDLERDLR